MLRIKRITATAALAVILALPATSAAYVAPAGAATPPPVDLRSPDTRDAARAISTASTVDLRSPDARDATGGNVSASAPVQLVERQVADGFQWGDAGIGAAGMLALVLLVASAVMAAGQRRRLGRATATGH